MKLKTDNQLSAMTPCQFEALVGAANARFKYHQAAEGPQFYKEEQEREEFLQYYRRILKEKQRRGL